MHFTEYQKLAALTDRAGKDRNADDVVPILGLAGEVGELVNEYKKFLRDGDDHTRFTDRMQEELGDIIWYIATAATRFGLDLEEVVAANLLKTQARWLSGDAPGLLGPRIFDATFPETERFPRHFVAEFIQREVAGISRIAVFVDGMQMGQELTDNAHAPDGYRFHDVFHLACAAVLGWSPVTRRNLGLKRRSDPSFDEVEDGGRAIVTEEGVSALVFANAVDQNGFSKTQVIDYDLLKAIRVMTAKFEVGVCTTGEWERAILTAYRVWKAVENAGGGKIEVNLDQRSMRLID